MSKHDPFSVRQSIDTPLGSREICSLAALQATGRTSDLSRIPYSIKVLLEACLRHCDGHIVTEQDVETLGRYDASDVQPVEIPFIPSRVVLQDFTGVPAIVDLAAMRSAISRATASA